MKSLHYLSWQAEEGISSQRRFARCWGLCGLSKSRFNRRARALLGITAQIVNDLNSRVDLSDQYMIIDSLPMPLCQPIRNRRAKVFEGTANIGYNSTKKFYSFTTTVLKAILPYLRTGMFLAM